jgi:hypothetical protein
MSQLDPKTATRTDLGKQFASYVRLGPYDRLVWFGGAYSTICRTLHHGFSPFTDAQIDDCSKILSRELPALTADSFDASLRNLVKDISNRFSVSIGHAQKLISIIIKYAYASHLANNAALPREWSTLIQSSEFLLPVPIDSIVLYSLQEIYPDDFNDVWAERRRSKAGKATYNAKIRENGLWARWSRISDFDSYWSIQTRIRAIASAANLSPLEFEMRHLWLTK